MLSRLEKRFPWAVRDGKITWTVKFAQSLNADSREPVFTVTTASDHINHNGSISIGGLTHSARWLDIGLDWLPQPNR